MENRANIEYWSWVIKHAKQNSQEIVDAHKNAKLNEGNAEKDLVFLKCIDLMLKKEK